MSPLSHKATLDLFELIYMKVWLDTIPCEKAVYLQGPKSVEEIKSSDVAFKCKVNP